MNFPDSAVRSFFLLAMFASPIAAYSTIEAQLVSSRLVTAFVGQIRPSIGVGLEVRNPIGRVPEPQGGVPIPARRWLWSGMIASGATWAHMDQPTPTVFGSLQVGVLYRKSPNERVGVYALGNIHPNAYGAVVRYEPKSPIAAQIGVVNVIDGRSIGAYGAVDVSLAFLSDVLGR